MKRKKLLEIADMLEKFRPSKKLKFNMSYWHEKLDDCGTACCAIGLAVGKEVLPKTFSLKYGDPWYRGAAGLEAIEKYFGISNDTCF